MTTTDTATGVCPACNGSTRKPVPEDTRKYLKYNKRWNHWGIAGYDPDTDTLPCTNCGGQTMSMKPTGQVPLRADGTPCRHEYAVTNAGRCLTSYVCRHCPHRYVIDSGD